MSSFDNPADRPIGFKPHPDSTAQLLAENLYHWQSNDLNWGSKPGLTIAAWGTMTKFTKFTNFW